MSFSSWASTNTSTANTSTGQVHIRLVFEAEPAQPQVTLEQQRELLAELKRRYHQLARQHHPDVGGSEEAMKRLNAWYEDKRAMIEALRVA